MYVGENKVVKFKTSYYSLGKKGFTLHHDSVEPESLYSTFITEL